MLASWHRCEHSRSCSRSCGVMDAALPLFLQMVCCHCKPLDRSGRQQAAPTSFRADHLRCVGHPL
jgi:hypothetical protein